MRRSCQIRQRKKEDGKETRGKERTRAGGDDDDGEEEEDKSTGTAKMETTAVPHAFGILRTANSIRSLQYPSNSLFDPSLFFLQQPRNRAPPDRISISAPAVAATSSELESVLTFLQFCLLRIHGKHFIGNSG